MSMKLTRNHVENKVSHAILVKVLHQIEVLRQSLVNRAGLVRSRLPEALTNVVDADPDGNEKILGRPWSLSRSGDQVVLELADLRDQVICDASVDNGVGNVRAVNGKVVSQHQRAVQLLSYHADPVKTPGGS